jgi:hypothetical protein
VGELHRIRETAIGHHRSEFDQPRIGEEEPWRTRSGIEPHQPATGATIAAYLAALEKRLSAGALARRAAIAAQHPPARACLARRRPGGATILRTARRVALRRRPLPPPAAQLMRMTAGCPGDLGGLRARALLLLAARPHRAGRPRTVPFNECYQQAHAMGDVRRPADFVGGHR